MSGSPEKIMLWMEVVTGTELDKHGVVQVLNAATWHERRRQLTNVD
jgi:hypothetical protein